MFINWVRYPGRTLAVGDCLGTAASFPPGERGAYVNNGRDARLLDNEGFNPDPPQMDPTSGEMAEPPEHRTALHPRHTGKGSLVYVDGHASAQTLRASGYELRADDTVRFDGDNSPWSGNGRDVPWTPEFSPLQ